MRTFYTTDTHFGHDNILKYDTRPWATIGEHDAALLANIMDVLKPGDRLVHLGDVAWDMDSYRIFLNALRKHRVGLVWLRGNHDNRFKPETYDIDLPELVVRDTLWSPVPDAPGGGLWVSHYPHRSWNRSFHGSGHLFGHVHGKLNGKPVGRALDLWPGNWDWKPVIEEALVERLWAMDPADV